jgi:diguanylate cyclase (GGDEF)-like protein
LVASSHQKKISVIFGLLLIPIILFGTLFIQQSRKDIAFAEAERLGIKALHTVMPVLLATTSYAQDSTPLRGLIIEERLTSRSRQALLQSNGDGTPLDPFHKAISTDFGLAKELEDLKWALQGGNTTQLMSIERTMEMIALIGDRSNLVLDSDLDTYYLMDVIVQRVPSLVYAMHDIRQNVSVLLKPELGYSPLEQSQSLVALGQFGTARTGMQNSLARAYRADQSDTVQEALGGSAVETDRGLIALEQRARSAVLNQSSPVVLPFGGIADLERQIDKMNFEVSLFWHATAVQLDLLLEKRIAGFEKRLYFALMVAGVVALLALLFAVRLFRSMLTRLDDKILYLAGHDHLTGLENRASITATIDQALADTSHACAVHLIDLDRFKTINDSRGHSAGDEVIKHMGSRLLALCNQQHAVGRLGGDEFVVLQRNIKNEKDVNAFAERMVATMRRPFEISEEIVHATASVGSAMAPRHGIDQGKLLVCADLALYAAKDGGRDRTQFYSEALEAASNERSRVEQELRNAVNKKRFDIELQGQYDVTGEQLRGFEALVRLKDSSGKRIPPGIFIPIAEQIGLIGQISDQVIAKSCASAIHWPPYLTLAVNLSPMQFMDGKLPSNIQSILQQTGMDPKRLTVEITEGLLLEKTRHVKDQLDQLQQMGIGIAIDDFGSGYSSLAYLSKFRFTKIKIDRSFIVALSSGQDSARDIIRTIITLGRAMRMTVIAEGVETLEEADVMRELACDEIQGYVYAKPVSPAEAAILVLNDGKKRLGLPAADSTTKNGRQVALAS